MTISRRDFIKTSTLATGALALPQLGWADDAKSKAASEKMRLGLVTYNWGKTWDLDTVIKNCSATGFEGVELRSTHKHGVEITLSASERKEVAKKFADSDVECVGLGSACEYHSADPKVVKKNIEETKKFIHLCHDIGGSGVKVRPNGLPKDVPVEKTLHQIGRSLTEVAKYGADYGVEIRVEVHGRGTKELPHMKTIMDAADHKNAVVCWNCNPTDLSGKGLKHNFDLVKDRIGTIHIHDLRNEKYPWKKLFPMLKSINFTGWTLLEDGKAPKDIVAAMHENRTVWEKLVAK